jgi:FixJ family two-component response regulator
VPQEPLIAIVEDDESLRESLVGLVRSLGYRASSFASADDFLAAGLAAACDCIVTDIQMPGLSGIDLKLKLAEGGCAVPVIMVTARTEQALHDRAIASGAVCLLRKPFAAEALIQCLEAALAA